MRIEKTIKEYFKGLEVGSYENIINIFVSINNPRTAAAHFRYHWILKNGTPVSFECVDVFQFDDNGKIRELTIIYDTSKIRAFFDEMKR